MRSQFRSTMWSVGRLPRLAGALAIPLMLLCAASGLAQTRTTVRDVIYNADGTRASGQVTISWGRVYLARRQGGCGRPCLQEDH